jgi:DNA-binding response OmpR family regulator
MTLKLLCAGKNDASFQHIKLAFEDEDVTTIRATSIALALFLARKNQPHLIICESNLVDGSGVDLLYELNNEDVLLEIPFAFLLQDEHKRAEIVAVLDSKGQKRDIHFLLMEKEFTEPGELVHWKKDILNLVN